MRDVLVFPHVEELRFRMLSLVPRSHDPMQARNLWSGYLIALAEWGLIDDDAYGLLRDHLYRLTQAESATVAACAEAEQAIGTTH